MKRTLMSENTRKEQLFSALNEYLQKSYPQLSQIYLEEVYEGMATVSGLSKNRINLYLENGRKIKDIPIDSQISVLSSRLDLMYVFLGRNRGKWWLLEVVSIGSVIGDNMSEAHVTFNPILSLPAKDEVNLQ